MIHPPSNKIGLGVMGVSSLDVAAEWTVRGANLISKFGDQTQLPVWAEACGIDYVWQAKTPSEIDTIQNPLTPSMPIRQPSLWWANPSPWPSGGKSEPQQWGPVGKPIVDIELVKEFAKRDRDAPLWVYDAGHKPYELRKRIESITDLGCAAMYDHLNKYPPQFAQWSCEQSGRDFIGVVNVQAKNIARPTTAQRVRRNCWIAIANGATCLLGYNVANCNDDTAMSLGNTYREIASYQDFILHGVPFIEHSKDTFPPWAIGPKLAIVNDIPKRITTEWELVNETLRVEIDLENDTVSIPQVTSSWRRP